MEGLSLFSSLSRELAADTTKAQLCRSYLESVSLSAKPEMDGVRSNLDVTNYSDVSSVEPAFGWGYLISELGSRAMNESINMQVKSDINALFTVYMNYDIVKTMTFTDGVTVSTQS